MRPKLKLRPPLPGLARRKARRGEEEVKEPEFGDRPDYLVRYVEGISKELGEPLFMDKLDPSLKQERVFNVIYPVGGGVFIHAYTPKDPNEAFNVYYVVEPPRPPQKLLKLVDEALASVITEEHVPRSAEEKKKILLKLLDEVLEPVDGDVNYDEVEVNPRNPRVPVKAGEVDYLKYHIVRDKVGVGVLEPFLRDPYLEDITCNGLYTPVFVYHTDFEWLTTSIVFNDARELESLVMKIAIRSGQEPSLARPVVEGVLKPEGYRVHIVLDVVSRRGHSFTIRKFRAEPFTVVELIRRETLDPGVVAILWAAIQYKQGVIIYGPTGAGKTTLLNALAMLLPPEYKIVTVEDTPEISIPFHDNWAAMHTRLSDQPGVQNITLQSQVESALRMRPDVIIVGEIRSREAYAFFQALATGHGGMTTVHAESAEVLIRRLASPPMNVPKSIIAAAKLYVHIMRIERGGNVYRKVVRIDESRGYDPDRDEIMLGRLMVWDMYNDVWRLATEESSFVKSISELLLVKPEEVWKDIEMRATVIKWAAERNADIVELHEIVRRYMREPEKVYEEALSETRPYMFLRV